MKHLSIFEQYILCSLYKKGKISSFNKELRGCIIVAGLLDLLQQKNVAIDEKKQLTILSDLNEDKQYLQPIFDYIKENQPLVFEQFAEHYAVYMTEKWFKEFVLATLKNLEDKAYIFAEPGEVFHKFIYYHPNKELVDSIIKHMRKEILEQAVISEEVNALVSLLDASFALKQFFAPFETDTLKQQLKKTRETTCAAMVKRIVDDMEDACFLVFSNA